MKNRFVSSFLSLALVMTSIPVFTANAADELSIMDESITAPPKLSKTDDPDYDPVFSFAPYQDTYDSILSKSADINDIGKLPDYEEFRTLTGYSPSSVLTLTKYRSVHGQGSSFDNAPQTEDIYIVNEEELDLLSSLVNNTVEGETSEERAFYSAARYKLGGHIDYSGDKYKPIGDISNPFNGTFDGDGWEIDNIKMYDNIGETNAIYTGTQHAGFFGCIGENGVVRNLGINSMKINMPYTLGGDVGFIAGRNYGLIDTCYVYSRLTSRIDISNATVGGIVAENFGQIKSSWADAFIAVDTEAGSYSEPQPIATVNHDGAVITNCYFIRHGVSSFSTMASRSNSADVFRTDMSADNGTSDVYVGWKYSGDKSLINGTGIPYSTFISKLNTLPGMSAYGNGFVESKADKLYRKDTKYNRSMSIDMNDLYYMVGSGSDFNVDYLDFEYMNDIRTYNGNDYQPVVYANISSNEDWQLFCRLVDKLVPGETDAEQAFWSKVCVSFTGETQTIGGKSVYALDVYQDDAPLGTQEYPYNGFVLGENITLHLRLENHNDGNVSPIFGYFGDQSNASNLNIVVTGSDLSGYENKPILMYQTKGELNNITMRDNSYRAISNNEGVNVYPDHANFSEITNRDYGGFYLIEDLSQVKGVYSLYCGFAYQWYNNTGDTTPAGYNYVYSVKPGSTISGSNIRIYEKRVSGETCTGGASNTTDIGKYILGNLTFSRYNSRANGTLWRDEKNYHISSYPSLGAPEVDANGVYLVRTVQNFIWLLKRGNGMDAKLMNSIDMSNVVIKHAYPGYFNLDGTLIDDTDVCSAIDLGVTKCYGILNLQIENTPLAWHYQYSDYGREPSKWSNISSRTNVDIGVNNINYSNIYFIGGKFTSNGNVELSYIPWLGKEARNVHLSMDQYMLSRYSSWTESIGVVPFDNAHNSSVSSKMMLNSTGDNISYGFASALAYESNECVAYTHFEFMKTGNGVYYGLSNIVRRGLSRMSTHYSDTYSSSNYYHVSGYSSVYLGREVYDSRADKVYDFESEHTIPIHIFGYERNDNIVVSGEIKSDSGLRTDSVKDFELDLYTSGTCAKGIVFTPESHLSGRISFSYASNVFFKGTYDYYMYNTGSTFVTIDDSSIGVFEGKVNFHGPKSDEYYSSVPSYYSDLGLTKSYSASYGNGFTLADTYTGSKAVSNTAFDFSDLSGIYTDNFSLTVIYCTSGSGHNINYSDIKVNVPTCIAGVCAILSGTNYNINYGDIYLGDNCFVYSSVRAIRTNGGALKGLKNFGDIEVHEGIYFSSCCAIQCYYNNASDCINYGNIIYHKKSDKSAGFRSISAINGRSDSSYDAMDNTGKTNINYGDIKVILDSANSGSCSFDVFGNVGGVNFGDIELTGDVNHKGSITVSGSTYKNYGNINVHDFSCTGDIVVASVSFYGQADSSRQRGYYNEQWNGISKSDITIENVTAGGDLNYHAGAFYFYPDLHDGKENDIHHSFICEGNTRIKNVSARLASIYNSIRMSSCYSTNVRRSDDTGDYSAVDSHGSLETDIRNNVLVEGVNAKGLLYNGLTRSMINGKFVGINRAHVEIKDSTLTSMIYSGCSVYPHYGAKDSLYIVNSDVDISNIALSREGYIGGITACAASFDTSNYKVSHRPTYEGFIGNSYNFGHMNIDVHGANIYVSGIGNADYINSGTRDTGVDDTSVVNACDITVTNDKDITLCGVNYSTTSNARVYNAINCGKLTANGDGKVNIYGISNRAKEIRSVENYGNIQTNNANCDIAAIAGRVDSTAYGFVNYGNIIDPNLNAVSTATLISAVSPSNAETIAKYGINYGNFTNARSVNSGILSYVVDLTGNENVVPNVGNTFVLGSVPGTANKTNRGLNVFSTVIGSGAAEEDEMISRGIDYDAFISPDFGMRFNNNIITAYTAASVRQEYNGDNPFDYDTLQNLRGKLKEKVEGLSGDGGYVLCCYHYDGKCVLGKPVECCAFDYIKDSNVLNDWQHKLSVDDTAFDTYFETVIRQVGKAQGYNIYDINVSSADTYTLKAGGEAKVENISTLTPFQGSVEYNNSYTQNILTISDVYITSNLYEDINNQDITFNFDVARAYDSEVHLYANPVSYETYSDFKQALCQAVINPAVTSESSTATVNMGEVGDTHLYILGYVEAKDSHMKNIIGLRFHNRSTDPAGWLTSFSYPVDYADKAFVYDDVFVESQTFYDDSLGYQIGENDDVVVEKVDTDAYSYPLYTMSEEMVRTTFGEYPYDQRSKANNTTGKVSFSFGMQNVVSYRAVIEGEKNSTIVYYNSDAPEEGSSSTDGIATIKHDSLSTAGNKFKFDLSDGTHYTNESISSSHNPFLRGGNKTITVYGTNTSGEETILFKVNLLKEESFENYILKEYPDRYYYKQHDSTATSRTSSSPLRLEYFVNNTQLNAPISALATHNNPEITIGDTKDHKKGMSQEQLDAGVYTKYPTNIVHSIDIIAENGESVNYSNDIRFVDFDKVDFTSHSVKNLTGSYARYTIDELSETFDAFLYVNKNKIVNTAEDFFRRTVDGTEQRVTTLRYIAKRADIYVDGVYHHTALYNEKKNTIYDSVYGLSIKCSRDSANRGGLSISKDNSVPKADLPDGLITIKTYAEAEIPGCDTIGIVFDDVTFSKHLSDEHQLISVHNDKRITTPFVSDAENEISENIDIETTDIIYNVDYKTVKHIYVNDTVEPNVTSATIGYVISDGAILQKKNGDEWVNVGTSTGSIISENKTFTTEQLGAGCVYEYRIISQDYSEADTADPERAEHYTLITHTVRASTRNKKISILFDETDATTMSLYDEIINQYGNLSIEVRNMNGEEVNYHQTKVYMNDASKESNYYNISVGNYAIITHLPEGYDYSIRIDGGSSEGTLKNWAFYEGKKLRLPYANEQTISMKVRLVKRDPLRQWGVKKSTSFFENTRYNTI